MAIIDREKKQLIFKVLYCGAPGAGKGANLAALSLQTSQGREAHQGKVPRGELVAKHTNFRFLPIAAGELKSFAVVLNLYTVPDDLTRQPLLARLLFTGIDGLVFVVDTERQRLAANINAWTETRGFLQSMNQKLESLALVMQYNRQEGNKFRNPQALRHHFLGAKPVEAAAIANKGIGTLETLVALRQNLVEKLISPTAP